MKKKALGIKKRTLNCPNCKEPFVIYYGKPKQPHSFILNKRLKLLKLRDIDKLDFCVIAKKLNLTNMQTRNLYYFAKRDIKLINDYKKNSPRIFKRRN